MHEQEMNHRDMAPTWRREGEAMHRATERDPSLYGIPAPTKRALRLRCHRRREYLLYYSERRRMLEADCFVNFLCPPDTREVVYRPWTLAVSTTRLRADLTTLEENR